MADRGVSGGVVSYEAAIDSLRAMFPDVDVAVVEALLQANREFSQVRSSALACQ
jgi:hypothetical protein